MEGYEEFIPQEPAIDVPMNEPTQSDALIIRALREAYPNGIAGTDLARMHGLTRGAIWARIDTLRSAGFDIEASPHYGYRLISGPQDLIGDDIMARLNDDCLIGKKIQVFRETTSTNDVAERLAQDGLPEGTVVMAESQSAGKGRLGRQWVSPGRKSLLFSIILRPDLRPTEVSQLTLMAACSIAGALTRLSQDTFQIKWPNDVLYQGKKVAGILTEMRCDMDRIRYVILGIGINILQGADDFPDEFRERATSLAMTMESPPTRPEVAAAVLGHLDRDLQEVRQTGFAPCLERWKSMSCTLNRWITLRMGNQEYAGRAESIDETGALWIRTEAGKLLQFNGGEVTTQRDMSQ